MFRNLIDYILNVRALLVVALCFLCCVQIRIRFVVGSALKLLPRWRCEQEKFNTKRS